MDKALSEDYGTMNKKRLVGELSKGRDWAAELLNLVRRQLKDDGSFASVEDLSLKILGTFTRSLKELDSFDTNGFPASVEGVAGESGKKPAPAGKDRRGCYKRRKTSDSRIIYADTIDDGHAWRKYGQKEILNSKNPRCYFRCTYKSSQECKALKQVQKLDDDSKYHITYFGYHSCQNVNKPITHIFSHSGAPNSFVLNFGDSKNHHHLKTPNTPSTITNTYNAPSAKHEEEEDASKAQSDDVSDNVSSPNYAQSSLASSKEVFGHFEPPQSSMMGKFGVEDSCASIGSSDDYMEYLKNLGNLDHDFQFDDEFMF